MRKVLVIVSLPLLVVIGVAAGYLYAVKTPTWLFGDDKGHSLFGGDKKPTGVYRDEEVLAMRKKLPSLSLPISDEQAFVLLGIDRSRLGEPDFSGQGWNGNTRNTFTWRLSPTYGIAIHEEYGRDFCPKPPANKPITRIAIGKCIPASGTPADLRLVVLDEADTEQTEIKMPPLGKGGHWNDWSYPNVAKTLYGTQDHNNIGGGFAVLTTDDFDKVLGFYYDKCGVEKGTMQWNQGSSETKEGVRGDCTMFQAFESDPNLPALRSRSLNLKKPAYSVSITIVQAQGQKETHIFVNLW
jgi:hypothetical protein